MRPPWRPRDLPSLPRATATAKELMKRWASSRDTRWRAGFLASLPTKHDTTIPAMARCAKFKKCAINPALTRTPVLHCASSRPLLLHLLRRSNSLRSDPLRHFPLSCCACIALPVSLTCRFFCGNHFCNTNHHQSQFYNDSKST